MIITLRQGFGLNTNLFETNILNLTVVIGVVIKVVGDSLRSLLDQRRKTILSTLQEADLKAKETKQRLEAAQRTFEEARLRVQEIRIQTIQAIEREKSIAQRQLEKDIQRLRERKDQRIQLEQQRATQSISDQISTLALNSAETMLLTALDSQNTSSSKQKELNEVHVRKTFCQLSRSYHIISLHYQKYFRKRHFRFSHLTYIVIFHFSLRLWQKSAPMKLAALFDNKLNNTIKLLAF